MTREQLHAFARAGASLRIKELQEELAAILKTFPELKTDSGRRAAAVAAEPAPKAASARSRKWSPADRKAVSARMKKYWASRKAQAGKDARAPK